jgi:predicted Zn-dependent peptidase
MVIAGDADRAEVLPILAKAFAGWKAKGEPLGTPTMLPARTGQVRTFVVGRPDAPQVVMSLASEAPPASDPAYPLLELLNIPLGGSFTSRLNQNLREDHGWTYGARSSFNLYRRSGMFVVRAAVHSDALTPALKETVRELDAMTETGPTADELAKSRKLATAWMLGAYATPHALAASLATDAALDLGPDADSVRLSAQQRATEADLALVARKNLAPRGRVVVLLGPEQTCRKALAETGLPPPVMLDEEGHQQAGRPGGATLPARTDHDIDVP